MVYVLDKDRNPLMPCENVIARLLLKEGKAKVLQRCPFVIKLNIDTAGVVKKLTLAQDTGSGTLGAAVSDDNGIVYYQSEVKVRNNIKSKMDERRSFRRTRRGCKTRYRKPRFKNRGSSKREGRLNPTMISKLNSHIKEINFIKKILPIDKIIFETGTFNVAALKVPSLYSDKKKHWAYQKGVCYGFENIKAAVRHRDGYKCKKCGKSSGKLEIHHITFRSNGGTDIPENLVTVCPECHKKIHDGSIPNFKRKQKDFNNLKYASQMNVIRSQLLKMFPEAIETFGYITSANMMKYNIKKSHANDATMIATGGKKPIFKNDVIYYKSCNSKGDYKKTKGSHSELKTSPDKIGGIKRYDKVSYFGVIGFVKGRMAGTINKNGSKGDDYAILMDIHGNVLDFSYMPKGFKTPKIKNLKRITARTSWMIIEEARTANIA